MPTTRTVQYQPGKPIRVFLASPGDVPEERAFVREFLREALPASLRRLTRGHIEFQVIAWDDTHDPLTMPAHLTPQQAVEQFKGCPRDCDIVIVIIASRLGTHLSLETYQKPDGSAYRSGTEWEFLDAWSADPRPVTLVYRRADLPAIAANDPMRREKNHQLDLVEAFFQQFSRTDGAATGSYHPYTGLDGFRNDFRAHIEIARADGIGASAGLVHPHRTPRRLHRPGRRH